jgi:hypothetical protein
MKKSQNQGVVYSGTTIYSPESVLDIPRQGVFGGNLAKNGQGDQ